MNSQISSATLLCRYYIGIGPRLAVMAFCIASWSKAFIGIRLARLCAFTRYLSLVGEGV